MTVTVRPADEASWEDLHAVFGDRGEPGTCYCQWLFTDRGEFRDMPDAEKRARFRQQTGCDDPDARDTSGLVAYVDGEPAGWCAVEPRADYTRLRNNRVTWAGRDEDKDDPGVWAVACFVVRPEFRRRGISRSLASAAVTHARERGATAIEGYPMQLAPGKEDVWGELFVGPLSVFLDAGFREVTHPTARRHVVRIDFAH